MFSWFSRLNNNLEKLENFLLPALLIITLVLAVLQIILRNVFSSGIFWAEPLLKVLVLWLAMFGAMYATRKRRHIKIDILNHYLKGGLKKLVARIVFLASSIICLLCSYFSLSFLVLEYEDGTRAFMQVPAWLVEGIIPVALFIMALRFLYFSFKPGDMD